MNMSGQISAICKSVNFHIRNLWRIRKFITREACHHAVRSLVLSRIDYANSCFTDPRKLISNIQWLQRLQNKAARSVLACGRDQSSSHLLCTLLWLQVEDRIKYKNLLYVYKSLDNQAPKYLTDILKLYNASKSTEDSRRRLRSSSDATRLFLPYLVRSVKLGTIRSTCAVHGFGICFRWASEKRRPSRFSKVIWKRITLFPKDWFFLLCVIVYIVCIFPCIYCFVFIVKRCDLLKSAI